jgi:hypothetical protein
MDGDEHDPSIPAVRSLDHSAGEVIRFPRRKASRPECRY